MNEMIVHGGLGLGTVALLTGMVGLWVGGASSRLEAAAAAEKEPSAAVASVSDEGYCSGQLRPILRRVLTSCGLVKSGGGRGCQPLEAKNVAAMSGSDFNALFSPLADRAAIVQFEQDSAILDDQARGLLDKTFADQRGASYFLVVSRASPEGSAAHNSALSQERASAVLEHLKSTYNDPDLEQEVGLLWLGEEFAQLDEEFCKWNRSHSDAPCSSSDLNRSAFVAWIDCRL